MLFEPKKTMGSVGIVTSLRLTVVISDKEPLYHDRYQQQ